MLSNHCTLPMHNFLPHTDVGQALPVPSTGELRLQDSPPVPHAGLPARAYRQAAPEWSPCLACARFPTPAQTSFLVGHRYEGAAPADPTRVPAPVAPPKRTAVLRLAQPPHHVSHEHGGVAPAGPAAAPARGLPPARRARMTRMNRTLHWVVGFDLTWDSRSLDW